MKPLLPYNHIYNRKSGFTLIELLTVIAIVGVLAAILIPTISNVRKKAQSTEAVSNIRQIGAAALLYANENRGQVPGRGNDKTTGGMGVAGALYPYLEARLSDGLPTWPVLTRTYLAIRDPRLPDELLQDGWKWVGYNGIFASYPQGPDDLKKEEKLLRFEEPGKVIYAATGNENLKVNQASNEAQLPLPEAPREGFYFAHDGAVPAVFLDGHAELLEFPIDPRLLNPDYRPTN
jgi:prepilin-type N-terminal cleavage/methylation domain-containing protein/prepilin-type processing-associated H-X9-DG protein